LADHGALALADFLAIRALMARSVQREGSLSASCSSRRAISALIEATVAFRLLPKDKTAFNKVRYRWVDVVRGHPMLTPAQRQVGLAIAQQHINRRLGNPWFNSAWVGHQTIALETGLTRRTVVTAMAALGRLGLIAIEHGGGTKVPGGRTDRYTLRTDWLDVLELAARTVPQKDVKTLHGSNYLAGGKSVQSGEKDAESGEIEDQMIRKLPNEDVKELRTTLSNNIPLGGGLNTFRPPPPSAAQLAATEQAGNGRKEDSEGITAQDHLDLALLLGEGSIERGYGRLRDLSEADANTLAFRYRLDRSSGEAVRAEAARLEANLRRSG
jgi:hypothetical protein